MTEAERVFESIIGEHKRSHKRKRKSAVETMRDILTSLQESQTVCINEQGFTRPGHTEKYRLLTRKIRAFKESIEWMEEMYNG